MQESRLAKAEAKLSGWQRVLAWMHRQQQLGGFVEIATRNVETNLASSTPVVIDDLDAAFVFECVKDCNIRVLELNEAHLEKGLLSLCLNRFLNTTETPTEDWEIAAFRRALKVFVLKWMVFERAIQIISDQYLSGMQALYQDSAEMLKNDLEAAEIFLAGFNVKVAPRFGTNSITPCELAEYIHIAGPREAEIITTLARAKAEFAFGNRLAACPLIAEAIRLTESPEELGDLLGNSATDKRRAMGQKPQ
jgi:hypothetical protein